MQGALEWLREVPDKCSMDIWTANLKEIFLAVFEIIYVVHWYTDFIILNKIGWIYIVFLSFWSRIKRVHNNSQKVEFDKWHTFDTFMKLILKKHSIWNVSLIFFLEITGNFFFLLNYTLDCIIIIRVVFYSDEINIVESHLSRHLRSHVNFFGIGYTIDFWLFKLW